MWPTFETIGQPGGHPRSAVVVRQQPEVKDGDIVVAVIGHGDEAEATVKTLRRSYGHVWLMAQNQNLAYLPIPGSLAPRRRVRPEAGETGFHPTKTLGSAVVLPLPDICLTALKLRTERQAPDRSRGAEAWQDPELVFTSTYGTPYEPRNFNRQFAVRCRKAGVRYIRVHDTRRICAWLLVALDVHPRVAMQILRHSQIAMTMETYSEVPTAKTRSAFNRLGRQLDG